jgi:hypothetical protein
MVDFNIRAGWSRAERARRALICAVACALPGVLASTQHVAAQDVELTSAMLHRLRIEATPIGALPRNPLRMVASRNHNYWAFRLHSGYQQGRFGTDKPAVAGGIDLQWLGGSVFGVTAGYSDRDCRLLGPKCGGHFLAGIQGQSGLLTGASRLGELFGDYGANASLGAELGFGWAPDATPGGAGCTINAGMPMTLAMLQTVRVVGYVTPSVVWELDCGGEPNSHSASYMLGGGVGVQQLLHRAFDVSFGMHRLLRAGSRYNFGVSLTYTFLP